MDYVGLYIKYFLAYKTPSQMTFKNEQKKLNVSLSFYLLELNLLAFSV